MEVAEDGTWSKRESNSSFCLPKVYPVVYTPRGPCSKSRESHTVEQKEYVTYLFSEKKRGSLRLAVGGTSVYPVLSLFTGPGKEYQLLH